MDLGPMQRGEQLLSKVSSKPTDKFPIKMIKTVQPFGNDLLNFYINPNLFTIIIAGITLVIAFSKSVNISLIQTICVQKLIMY